MKQAGYGRLHRRHCISVCKQSSEITESYVPMRGPVSKSKVQHSRDFASDESAHIPSHRYTHTHTHTWAQYNKWRGRNVSIFIFKKMKNSFDLSFVWSNSISFLLPFSQHEWDTPVYALPFRELKCPKLENYQVLMLTLAEHEVTLNPLHLYSEVLLW